MTDAMAFDLGKNASRSIAAPGSEQLTLRQLDTTGLRTLPAQAWDSLSAAALSENPFYDRGYVMAGLDTLDRVKAVCGYAFETANGQLVGLFLTQPGSNVPAPFPVANSLANIYQFEGEPLLHRDHAAAVANAWAGRVAKGDAPGLWAFADLDTSSAVSVLLQQAATAKGLHWRIAIPYKRAHLTKQAGSFENHLHQVLSKNRLHDVRRTMRRLGEAGQFELEHVTDGDAFAARLEDFLRLEHSGWKGTQGTSFLSRPQDATFARAAYRPGLATLDSLLFNSKPIAMKLSICTGRIVYTPKIAYDESFKKLGPGMALEYLLIESFFAGDSIDGVDSSATSDSHSALNFFDAVKPMGTVIVGRHKWQADLLARLHDGRKALKIKIKALIAQWQARKTKPTKVAPEAK
jgi:hypothetical protein